MKHGIQPLERDEVWAMHLVFETGAGTIAEGPLSEQDAADMRTYMEMGELATLTLLSEDPHNRTFLTYLQGSRALLALNNRELAKALRDRGRGSSGTEEGESPRRGEH